MWLLFFIILMVLIVLLMPSIRNNFTQSSSKEGALEILQKRLARGEINQEEYDRLKQTLDSE